MAIARARREGGINYWPGFVDALSTLILGIVFLPFATLMYVLFYTPGVGLVGWEWFWVVLAGVIDVGHLAASAKYRMGR